MEKKLNEKGIVVNDYIVKAQVALAGYNFYTGNRADIAPQQVIDEIRELLCKAEHLSRQLSVNEMIAGPCD